MDKGKFSHITRILIFIFCVLMLVFSPPEKFSNKEKREKGRGFLGILKRPDKGISTEISIGVNIKGEEIDIPTLIPTLTQIEIEHLLSGQKPTPAIVDKAVKHAVGRIAEGKDPFYREGEELK